ncbi:hypothetical protein [Tepidibacter formicigenes]|jgi:hypothetical protein|uniref:Uncharacterized protein n=1 Tax=Tepidibacter formicigenes DSM 15518 TaxID=1123349 RepID=A0A1M6TZC5_9FIRM|nr:hypothetical protein [Tepidibacter formicigenes]SHK62234.1 hypothetical protein SAMN02744037_02707 [Tepidibacter formicigenes DSM 15518]
MLYIDLSKGLTMKINGTLSAMLRTNSFHSANEVYKEFLDVKIFKTKKGIYYNEKPYKDYDKEGNEIVVCKKEYKLDEEFLEDIQKIIAQRFEKKKKRDVQSQKEFEKRMKQELATDKQKKYASKLYNQLHGEKKKFDDKDYTKQDMSDIIQDLLSKIENDNKVIEVDFRR